MLIRSALFAAGLLLLYGGAEGLVRGASRLARTLGVSALVVGLTVVAFGTSAPELVVSLAAGVRGETGVAIGNVVGSNIVNIALILGLSALVVPLRVESRLVTREIPVMILATALLGVLLADGGLSRLDGGLLLVGFGGFLALSIRKARGSPEAARSDAEPSDEGGRPGAPERSPPDPEASPAEKSRLRSLLLALGGLGALVLGAHLFVDSSVYFARRLGMSEYLVGITIVAVGTSLPELATSLVAALRRQSDMAIGNIVGSNLFNVLGILGAAPLVRPLPVDAAVLRFDFPVMFALSALLLPLAWTDHEVRRWEGVLVLACYAAFLWILIGR